MVANEPKNHHSYPTLTEWNISNQTQFEEFLDYIKTTYRVGDESILIRTINRVRSSGATEVLVEDQYVDSDFLDDTRSVYSHMFPYNIDPTCRRLHFFSKKLHPADFLTTNPDPSAYFGNMILHPVNTGLPVGRTNLRPFTSPKDSQYFNSFATIEANVDGMKLSVQACPYIERDSNVGMCAHSVLWMVASQMRSRFNYPRFRMSEIRAAAERFVSIGAPQRGLTVGQMVAALSNLGYKAHWIQVNSALQFRELAYAYLESGLPVLALLKATERDGHAVMLVGHDFVSHNSEKTEDNTFASEWIHNFLIHDDSSGPYELFPVAESIKDALLDGTQSDPPLSKYTLDDVTYLICIAPHDVLLNGDDLINAIYSLCNRTELNRNIRAASTGELDEHVDQLLLDEDDMPDKGIIMRPYLISQNEFKSTLPVSMPESVKHSYRGLKMPRYVWVVEFLEAQIYNVPGTETKPRIGEVIFNASSDRNNLKESYLAFHIRGRMVNNPPGKPLEVPALDADFANYEMTKLG